MRKNGDNDGINIRSREIRSQAINDEIVSTVSQIQGKEIIDTVGTVSENVVIDPKRKRVDENLEGKKILEWIISKS